MTPDELSALAESVKDYPGRYVVSPQRLSWRAASHLKHWLSRTSAEEAHLLAVVSARVLKDVEALCIQANAVPGLLAHIADLEQQVIRAREERGGRST